jgi:hypothetical protein
LLRRAPKPTREREPEAFVRGKGSGREHRGRGAEITGALPLAKRNSSTGEEMRTRKFHRSWLMALCVVGMRSVSPLPALGLSLGSVGSILFIPLCPLSHLLMIRGGHGDHTGHDMGAGLRKPLAIPAVAAGTAAVKDEPLRVQD